MSKRLQLAAIVLLLLTPGAVAWSQTITYGPILGRGVTPDQMIVKWGTGLATDTTAVGFRPAGSSAAFTVVNGDTSKDHEVVLTGLSRDAQYEYYVQSGTTKSASHTLATCPAPGAPMDLVFYGDSRSGTSEHMKIMAQIVAKTPDMVFESGDIEPYGYYSSYLSDFFPVAGALVATTPFMATPGNHDALQPLASNYGLVFPAPRPVGQPWSSYYAFTCGNAMFIGLDSNSVTSTTQKTFLENKLIEAQGNPDVGHVFVWFHHSPYSPGSGHGDDTTVQQAWVGLFESASKVDAVFTGHDHIYARMHHGTSKVAYVVSGGAGAGLYSLATTTATVDSEKSSYNFVVVHLAGGVATGTAYDDNGAQLDSFTINQPWSPSGAPADGGVAADMSGGGTAGGDDAGAGGGGTGGGTGGGGNMQGTSAGGCEIGTAQASALPLALLLVLGVAIVLVRRARARA